jgi:hypothetical protein
VDNELERIWKAAVMFKINVLSRHLPGGTEENRIFGVLEEIRT